MEKQLKLNKVQCPKQNKLPLISVSIPCYNAEKTINKCLDGLLTQTYKNLEIVCVNDGSKDNTQKIIEDYAKKDKRIVLVNKQNEGVGKAFRDGVKNSKGEYLCFVDSDDYVENDFVQELYNSLIKNKADIAVCNYFIHFNEDTKSTKFDRWGEVFVRNDDFKSCSLLLTDKYGISPNRWNKIYKRQIVLDALPFINFDIKMGEDINFNYATFSMAKKIVINPKSLYHYIHTVRLRDNRQDFKMLIKQLIIINQKYCPELIQNLYRGYIEGFFVILLRYFIKIKDKKGFKEIFNESVYQDLIKNIEKNSTKRKMFYAVIRTKNWFLIKTMLKMIKQ